MPGEDRAPAFKLRWSGWEDGKLKGRVGVAPHAVISNHIWVQTLAAFPIPNCDPAAAASSLILRKPFANSSSILVQYRDFVGVGHNEEPPTLVGCADLCRREQARFDAVAHCGKVCEDAGGSQGQVPFDVFEEAPFGVHLRDDSADVRPEVAGIVLAAPLAGKAEGLAGIAGSEEMNAAAPRAAVEGGNVRPDRSLIQGLVAHPRHESGRREGFPLDETNSSIGGLGDMEAEFEATDACAECDAGEGRNVRGM